MNVKPASARPHAAAFVIVAALAVPIGLGLLSPATGLFQRDGAPFEEVVVAKRACADHRFVSERRTCVRAILAATAPIRHAAAPALRCHTVRCPPIPPSPEPTPPLHCRPNQPCLQAASFTIQCTTRWCPPPMPGPPRPNVPAPHCGPRTPC